MTQIGEIDLDVSQYNNVITRANVRPRVLVVDDQPLYIQVAIKMLSPYYNMLTALNGADALQILSRSFVDLLLLDVEMPEMSGIEVFENMRENDNLNTLPVVFVTAEKDSQVITRVIRMGAKDYIVKPFDQKTLLFKVRKVIDNAPKDQGLLFLKRQLTFVSQLFQEGKISDIEPVITKIPYNEYSKVVFLKCKRMLISLRSLNMQEAAQNLDVLLSSL